MKAVRFAFAYSYYFYFTNKVKAICDAKKRGA